MSALGQKQTFSVQNVMSALPPKADICGERESVIEGGLMTYAASFTDLFRNAYSPIGAMSALGQKLTLRQVWLLPPKSGH